MIDRDSSVDTPHDQVSLVPISLWENPYGFLGRLEWFPPCVPSSPRRVPRFRIGNEASGPLENLFCILCLLSLQYPLRRGSLDSRIPVVKMKVYLALLSLLTLGVAVHATDPDPNEFPSSAVSLQFNRGLDTDR